MMTYQVKQKEVQGLNVLINTVDSLYHNKEVHSIRKYLLKLLKKPTNYTGLSQAEIDKIFKPVEKDWADENDDGGYGAIKPVFALIKKLMFEEFEEFEDESKGKRISSGEEW